MLAGTKILRGGECSREAARSQLWRDSCVRAHTQNVLSRLPYLDTALRTSRVSEQL